MKNSLPPKLLIEIFGLSIVEQFKDYWIVTSVVDYNEICNSYILVGYVFCFGDLITKVFSLLDYGVYASV